MAEVHRSTYRVFCLIAGILSPIFGLVYQATDPGAIDPPWARLVLSVVVLLMVSLSYMVPWVEKNFISLVRGYFYLLIAFVIGLTTLNGFSPNYTMGMLFAFTGMGVAFSLGLSKSIRPLTGYLLFTIALTIGAGFVTAQPEVSVWIVWVCVISTALIIYVVASAKIKAEEATEASERRYHTLMNAANDAIIIADPARGVIVDANQKALELLGQTMEGVRRLQIADLFPLTDRDRSLALFEKHISEKVPVGEDLFIVARDGRTIAVDLSASLIDVDGQQYIQGIVRDATERHRYEEQLIQAKNRAEELLRVKTNLLNNMSHELRTPITSILGFAEVISDEGSGEQQEHAQHIILSARRLHDTLNSLLGLAQLEGGGHALDVETVCVGDHLQDVISQMRTPAEKKGLALYVTNRAGRACVHADVNGLRRVITNLVDNAIKFTEHGEVRVELSLSANRDRVLLRVRDTGTGIAPIFIPHLFDEFQQESTGLNRSHEGSGLGLTVTRRIVDLMGGEIEVESEKGHGSTFTVYLPCVDPVAEATSGESVAWVTGGTSHLRRVAVK